MIRRIADSDRQLFIDFSNAFYTSAAVDHTIPAEYHERAFDELMRSDTYMFAYIIEHEGKSAGYALISRTYSHECGGMVWWIEELFILPEYRCKGLGREFFEYIRSISGPEVTRFRLEISPDNHRARALYKSIGFDELPYGQLILEPVN